MRSDLGTMFELDHLNRHEGYQINREKLEQSGCIIDDCLSIDTAILHHYFVS
jgi:hypothetical protein